MVPFAYTFPRPAHRQRSPPDSKRSQGLPLSTQRLAVRGHATHLWGFRKKPYEKSRLIAQYESHNRSVGDYFRLRPESLLTLNLSETDAAAKIMTFLKLPFTGETMPHLNRSV